MKKGKKIITGAIATFCIGVAVGALAAEPVTAKAAVYLPYDRTSLIDPPKCVLTLEEKKIKNMTDWDYCRVDEEYDAWYFADSGDGTAQTNPEVRFIADGVQTVTKPYTLTPINVGSFSFEYCMANDAPEGVLDLSTQDYIVQILASDGSYPIIIPEIEDDGDWHTIAVTGSTALYPNNGDTYAKYQTMFCGFLFKMGNLDGEFMIRNITVYDLDGNEITVEEETPDIGEESSKDSTSSSEEVTSSSEETATSSSEAASESSQTTASNGGQGGGTAASKKGCGSFGVGAMTLGALAAAGVVLIVRKRK